MANDKVCIFCGEKPGAFRSDTLLCGGTIQTCCKACARELKGASEEELCRRALRLRLAEYPHVLEKRLALITESEDHRPSCLRCGGKLRFGRPQGLDNSPERDSLMTDAFVILPAYCDSCGKIELYDPGFVGNNKFLSHLVKKDAER